MYRLRQNKRLQKPLHVEYHNKALEDDEISDLDEPLELPQYAPGERPPFKIYPRPVGVQVDAKDVIPGLTEPLGILGPDTVVIPGLNVPLNLTVYRPSERPPFKIYQPTRRNRQINPEDVIPGLSEPLDITMSDAQRAKSRAALIKNYIQSRAHSSADDDESLDPEDDIFLADINRPLNINAPSEEDDNPIRSQQIDPDVVQIFNLPLGIDPVSPPDIQMRALTPERSDPFVDELHSLSAQIADIELRQPERMPHVMSNMFPAPVFPYEFPPNPLIPKEIHKITSTTNMLWYLMLKYRIWTDVHIDAVKLGNRMIEVTQFVNDLKVYVENRISQGDTTYAQYTIRILLRDYLINHALQMFINVQTQMAMHTIDMIKNSHFDEIYLLQRFLWQYKDFFDAVRPKDVDESTHIWLGETVDSAEPFGFSLILSPRKRFYFDVALQLFPCWLGTLVNAIRRFSEIDITIMQAHITAVELEIDALKSSINGNPVVLGQINPFYQRLYTSQPGNIPAIEMTQNIEQYLVIKQKAETLADEYLKAQITYDSFVTLLKNGQTILYAMEHIRNYQRHLYVMNTLYDKTPFHRRTPVRHINDVMRVVIEENLNEFAYVASLPAILRHPLFDSILMTTAYHLKGRFLQLAAKGHYSDIFFATGPDWAKNGLLLSGYTGKVLDLNLEGYKNQLRVKVIHAVGDFLPEYARLLSSQWTAVKPAMVLMGPKLKRLSADDLRYFAQHAITMSYDRPVFVSVPVYTPPLLRSTTSTQKKKALSDKENVLVEKGDAHAKTFVTKTTVKKKFPNISAKKQIYYNQQ